MRRGRYGRWLLLALALVAGAWALWAVALPAPEPPSGNGGARGDGKAAEDGRVAPGDGPSPQTAPDEGDAPDGFDLEQVASDLERPVYLTHAGDDSGRLFVVEQPGRVRVLRDGRLAAAPFLDLTGRVASRGEQGLLSIAFHPGFAANGYVFASYTATDGTSVLARYRVDAGDPDRLDPDSASTLITVEQPYANHNGGLILFGPDGYLYLGLGDGGSAGDPRGNGQDAGTLLGSLLRLDVDAGGEAGYEAPPDNPFVNAPGRDEIWAFGLRNPWRFSFDRASGDLYIADVGQNRREEVNFAPASAGGARNYGWNAWEGSLRFRDVETASAPVFPVAEYGREGGHCSVTGGYVYRGEAVPALRGLYVFGDYCSGTVWALARRGGEWRRAELLRTSMRVTSFGQDAAGELYVVDHAGGVYRFVPGGREVPAPLARD